jgi:hypothetical protein
MFKGKPNTTINMAVIFICHIFLWAMGNQAVDIDWYVQLAPLPYLSENPLNAIFYLHGCPPGLSIVWYLSNLFGQWQYAVLHLFTIGLHLLSYYWLNAVITKVFQNNRYNWVLFGLMLNPLWFIYFKYPFYSTFLFAIVSSWLYVHYCQSSINKRLVQVALLLSIACLFRSSWHLFLITGFTLWYVPKTDLKAKLIALCFLLLPFSVYLKNYVLFGTFSGTTWSAMNWANGNHIPCKEGVAAIPAFIPISSYYNVLPALKVSSSQFKDVPQLQGGNIHDARIIEVNKAYKAKLDSCFSLKHSLSIWLKEGLFHYLESPSEYSFLYQGNHEGKVTHGILKANFPVADVFDLPNYKRLGKSGKGLELNLSLYTIIYPLIIFILLWQIKRLSWDERFFLVVLLFYSGAYSFIDFIESNRMRIEIEPLWYLFGFKAFSLVSTVWQKKMKKNISKTLA